MDAGAQVAAALAAMVVLLAGLATVLMVRRDRRRSSASAHDDERLLLPDDLLELEERLRQAEAEEAAIRNSLLCARLDLLVRREVPVRRVVAAPVAGAATVGFADGTAITVVTRRPAEAGVLLMYVARQRVLLRGYRQEDGRLVLQLRRPGNAHSLEVVALGLDQPS